MGQKSVIIATLILSSASLVTKLMGFFYRVFMSNAIGSEGMGIYQLILPIYGLAWSFTSAGFTTTISHITAQENVKRNSGNIKQLLNLCLLFSFIISIIISSILFFGSETIATVILKEPRTELSFKFLALAVPFMTAGSCIRGYFLGMQNPTTPAISQVLEQTVRILIVYFLIGLFSSKGLEIACAMAIIGIVIGEFISFVFVLCNYKKYSSKFSENNKPTMSLTSMSKIILTMSIPLCATRVVSSLLTTIENMLIPQQMQLYGLSQEQSLEIYGELTGMAMPLVFLPSAFLMAVSISLVPEISKACAVNNKAKIQKTVSTTFLFTFILGIGTASLFAVFPKEVCYIVYNQENLGDLLFPLAFICPFLYAQITMQGLLNGLGEQVFLFVNHLISSVITIGGILFLMPTKGLDAFLFSLWVSLIVSMLLCLNRLYRKTGVLPNVSNCFLKPLLAGLASSLTVRYISLILPQTKIILLGLTSLIVFLYILFLILLGCFSNGEINLLFQGKNNSISNRKNKF